MNVKKEKLHSITLRVASTWQYLDCKIQVIIVSFDIYKFGIYSVHVHHCVSTHAQIPCELICPSPLFHQEISVKREKKNWMKECNEIRRIAMMVLLKNHQGKRPSAHTSEVQRRLASLPGSSVNSPTQPEVSHRCGTWLRLVIHPILYRGPFALTLPLFLVSISTLGGAKQFHSAKEHTRKHTL